MGNGNWWSPIAPTRYPTGYPTRAQVTNVACGSDVVYHINSYGRWTPSLCPTAGQMVTLDTCHDTMNPSMDTKIFRSSPPTCENDDAPHHGTADCPTWKSQCTFGPSDGSCATLSVGAWASGHGEAMFKVICTDPTAAPTRFPTRAPHAMVFMAANMMCVNQHPLGHTWNYQRCEGLAHADHANCAFNPTVVNYAPSSGECQCAPPETIPCKRKAASTKFDLHVLAGDVSQGALVGVVGDPFTHDKDGKAVQFWLPQQKDSHLLTCGGVELHGHAMPSGVAGDHQQWFDRFRVVIGGAEMLKVEANTTMAVTVEGSRVAGTASIVQNGYALDVTRDSARFSAGDLVMGFATAVASKFVSSTMQKQHTHLDLRFEKLDTKSCSAGILAEIWGIVPMSKETTAMLRAPEQ